MSETVILVVDENTLNGGLLHARFIFVILSALDAWNFVKWAWLSKMQMPCVKNERNLFFHHWKRITCRRQTGPGRVLILKRCSWMWECGVTGAGKTKLHNKCGESSQLCHLSTRRFNGLAVSVRDCCNAAQRHGDAQIAFRCERVILSLCVTPVIDWWHVWGPLCFTPSVRRNRFENG